MLWLYALAFGAASTRAPGCHLPVGADLASRVALPFIISWWVTADARKRRRLLCYDYDSFVYFAFPLIVPFYLFQTRGMRAFFTVIWFAAMCLVARVPSLLLSLFRGLAP